MTNKELEPFLKETEFCDFKHSQIQKIAQEFKNKYPKQDDLAVALFEAVRDNILFRVGLWNRKASETLFEKEGCCTNKANLLVALLRAAGIPVGYGVMTVNAQEYFGPVMLPMFKKRVSRHSIHAYCFVYLNNEWIKCDPSDDKEFSKNTSYFNPTSKFVDWDGKSDACLNLDARHIIQDDGPLDNIDYIMSKKPKNAKGIILKAGNLYIHFLRQNNKTIKNTEELEPLFKEWLRNNHKPYYYLYFVACRVRDLKSKLFKNEYSKK